MLQMKLKKKYTSSTKVKMAMEPGPVGSSCQLRNSVISYPSLAHSIITSLNILLTQQVKTPQTYLFVDI